MPRLLSFSLLLTPAVGKEVRYLFASRKALLAFTSKLMRERFVGSRVPYLWDNGEWTLDLEAIKELGKPVNLKPVFEQVATLFSTLADMHPLPQTAKEEVYDAVYAAFELAGIEWYPRGEEAFKDSYSHTVFQGIPLTSRPPGT
jgi:hypothetical protein